MISLSDLDLPAGLCPAEQTLQAEASILSLDDIRQRVMADLPITLDEERALVHSIRRGYTMIVAPRARAKPAAGRMGEVAASATKGKKSSSQMLSALGGLDALDGV